MTQYFRVNNRDEFYQKMDYFKDYSFEHSNKEGRWELVEAVLNTSNDIAYLEVRHDSKEVYMYTSSSRSWQDNNLKEDWWQYILDNIIKEINKCE